MARRLFLVLSTGLLLLLLVSFGGCAGKNKPQAQVKPAPVQQPAKLTLSRYRLKLNHQLQDRGVEVIKVGQTITLMMPTTLLFASNSANLNEAYVPVLNTMAQYIRSFETTTINVTAFTAREGSNHWSQVLSTQQAQTLANYLWSRGIDSRFIIGQGLGNRKPIATNATASGRAQNRRLVLMFRYLS